MSVPEPLSFLEALAGYQRADSRSSADRPVRLGTIDPAYVAFASYPSAPPPARVTFDGETTLSTKAYGYALGFIPWPGLRVFLVPIGNTYIIGGALNPQTPQGFWQDATGTSSGTEFGGGARYDTDEGLVIPHDAAISGDLSVQGVGRRFTVYKTAFTDRTTAVTSADPHLTATLSLGIWRAHGKYAYRSTVASDVTTDFQVTYAGAYGTVTRFVRGPIVALAAQAQEAAMQLKDLSGQGLSAAIQYGTNGTVNVTAEEDLVFEATVAGTFAMHWARVGASGTLRLLNGSFIEFEKIA